MAKKKSKREHVWLECKDCKNRNYRTSVSVAEGEAGLGALLCFSPEAVAEDLEGCVAAIRLQVGQRGGIQPC